MSLKTFKIEFTASLAVYSPALLSCMSDELLERFKCVIINYCCDNSMACGEFVVKIIDSEGNEASSYQHAPEVME
jgi:hypothetical protein